MLTLISYDIVDNKRRTRVMRLLKGHGRRVQRSVFECDLNAVEFVALGRDLRRLIDAETDSVRCYPLDATTVQRVVIHGVGEVTVEPSFYLV